MLRVIADTLGEFGRTIRIIRRDSVKNGSLPITVIACSNSKGILKSKDNLTYRWCCCEKSVGSPTFGTRITTKVVFVKIS